MTRTTVRTETARVDSLDRLLRAAVTNGDQPAVIDNGAIVTYYELDRRFRIAMGQLAVSRSGDADPSVPLGVLASRDSSTMVLMLAALRAGLTYCPIDAALPATRKRTLMSLVGISHLLVTNPGARPSSDSAAVPVTGCADPRNVCAQIGDEGPPRVPGLENPACVLFTSGSTGSPKPVAIPRQALATSVRALRVLFGLIPQDRVLQFAAPSWDTALEEMLPAVAAGAAVVFEDDAYLGAFPQFVRAVATQRITVLNLSTAWWHELVLYLHEEGRRLPDCVRLVVIGGEPVNPGRLRAWCELDTEDIRLLNTYGCTETTMITHAVQLAGPAAPWELADLEIKVPLGRALPHVADHMTTAGELLVSGDNLALGYLGLPESTADSFPTADHGTGPARWFHTGDLVTRDDAGLVYPIGRVDDQLKVRGVRVHPMEVEAVLSTHPAVAASMVCGEEMAGQMSLTAYVVLSGAIGAKELRHYVRERLPSHFVPHRVHVVPALCVTPTGKVDRAATRRRFGAAEPGARR